MYGVRRGPTVPRPGMCPLVSAWPRRSSNLIPYPSTPRPESGATPRGNRARRLARPIVGAIVAAALLFPAAIATQVATETVVAAGSSCTGWDSQQVPPKSIRVFRNGKGKVETIDFRRYVEVVMASEWPDRLPMAALELSLIHI